jgi:hypothetical protein
MYYWHLICTALCIGVCTKITSIESAITQNKAVDYGAGIYLAHPLLRC